MALLGAAVLVAYLEQQSVSSRDLQSNLLRHEIFDHVASNVANEIEATFDRPVFDTLAAVNHPVLKAGRLDLIAAQFAAGLKKYPQIQSFFVWNLMTGPLTPDRVLFFDRESAAMPVTARPSRPEKETDPADPEVLRQTLTTFRRDPAIAAEIQQGAARHSSSQQIYFAVERPIGRAVYDIFARIFWVDANRTRYFAILGFVVDLQDLHTTLFPRLLNERLAPLLRRESDLPRLELRVLDESNQVVFGPSEPAAPFAGEAPFSLQFYPAEAIRTRTSMGIEQRRWRVVISQSKGAGVPPAWIVQPHVLVTGLSIVLMLVALALVILGSRRAGQLARMQAEFVSHVSHQLKTPLALLAAGCETLKLDRVHSPEKMRQYVGIIQTETARLSALVDRILGFSRVDARRYKYELEPVDVASLVHETVDAFAHSLGEGVEIRVEGTDCPVVNADAVAIEQVLVNLLDNALKYSPARKCVTVRVGCEGPYATVAVIDQGIGIAARDHKRIFDKFYRGAGAAQSRDGFGVGLAIVAELVKAHHGSVKVTSALGQGSTFTVRLPLFARSGTDTTPATLERTNAEKTAWKRTKTAWPRIRAS